MSKRSLGQHLTAQVGDSVSPTSFREGEEKDDNSTQETVTKAAAESLSPETKTFRRCHSLNEFRAHAEQRRVAFNSNTSPPTVKNCQIRTPPNPPSKKEFEAIFG